MNTYSSFERKATKLIGELSALPYMDILKALRLSSLSWRKIRCDMIRKMTTMILFTSGDKIY